MNIIFDIECYSNYFMITFTNGDKTLIFEKHNDAVTTETLLNIYHQIEDHTLVSFNGWKYDMVMFSAALHGFANADLKLISDAIILKNQMPWEIERAFNFRIIDVDHIDIINLCPLYASLKLYGARIGAEKLWELPISPDKIILDTDIHNMREYCYNDCVVTRKLFDHLKPQLDLRRAMSDQYGIDLRSKSDAQIAEAVIKSEYKARTNATLYKLDVLPKHITYTAPDWVKFETPELQSLVFGIENTRFDINPKNGQPVVPEWMKKHKLNINGKTYKIGLGGLHSVDKPGSYYSGALSILDVDVASYYPAIILNNGYAPGQMGQVFLDIYGDIVTKRLNAKKAGDKVTADALKITINGTFGKLGSKYSVLYSPQLMIQVTLTGQLALLMLIEKFAEHAIEVISANTDGITVRTNQPVDEIVSHWERDTDFDMEFTPYDSIHYRDVNNYIAITEQLHVKTKGAYKLSDLTKNPVSDICNESVINYIKDGKQVHETIYQCRDIRKFLTLRTVKGGAHKDGEHVGKAIRWYYSTDTDTAIHYESNNNKVADSQNGIPLMNLSKDLPSDLDYDYYIKKANNMLEQLKVFL